MEDTLDIKQFVMTLNQIAEEKNVPFETVKDALEHALAAAYRKDYGTRDQNIRVDLDTDSGEFDVFEVYDVVEEVEHDEHELALEDAKKIDEKAEVGGTVEQQKHDYKGFGRVAAQTAKQVILQKLREAEREVVFAEYSDKVGTILNGTVQRIEPRVVYVDLGRAQGILPQSEQIPREHYRNGQRVKVYLRDVESNPRGPQLVLSRAHENFVKLLFEREVPEMDNGAVEIKAIAREAGARTKIAVSSTVPGVDPVGTFVGGHGTRVQAVMGEIADEKIDIVMFDEDPEAMIRNALSPTEIQAVEMDAEAKHAKVMVASDQLSVGIGKQGQNVRLASKLTGWQIDIVAVEGGEEVEQPAAEEAQAEAPKKRPTSKRELEESLLSAVEAHGTEAETEEAVSEEEPAEVEEKDENKA